MRVPQQQEISAQVWICHDCGGHDPKSCGCAGATAYSEDRIKRALQAQEDAAEEREHQRQAERKRRAEKKSNENKERVDHAPVENKEEIEDPEAIKKNALESIDRHKAVAEAYRKVFEKVSRVSRFEDADAAEIRVAIERLIQKWKVVLSTLPAVISATVPEGAQLSPKEAARLAVREFRVLQQKSGGE